MTPIITVRRLAAAGAAASAVLLAPATAGAATLTTNGSCFEQGQPFRISGSGFTPLYNLPILGLTGDPSVSPDEEGSFTDREYRVPEHDSFVPKTVKVTVQDLNDPSRTTSVDIQAVRYGSNLPVQGRPGQTVTWRFAGWPAGATIYGHFRKGNRNVGTYRFGRASGPCGTLTVRAKRIPLKRVRRGGGWYLQVDTKPRFSFATRPEYDISFSN